MKRISTKADRGPPNKRQKLTNPVRRSSRLSEMVKSKSPFLQLPKEIRLQIYEYLLPCTGPVPSNRMQTDVNRMLEYSDSLESHPQLSLGQAGDLQAVHHRLRRSYTRGSWPAILRVNRQIFDEAHDLIHTCLSFQVDILTSCPYERALWSHQHPAQLHICSIRFDTPTYLAPHINHLRRLSVKIWFTRKVAEVRGLVTPYIANSAKSIKDHVNGLVLAMQQSPCLKTVEVELQMIRESRPYRRANVLTPQWRRVYPAILEDEEIAAAVSWYLHPFKLLRDINMSCRYITAKASKDIQGVIQKIESEVRGTTTVTTAKPLCALFAQFKQHSRRIFEALDGLECKGRAREGGLPVLYEKLWIAQDTGDLVVFQQAQKEILGYWRKTRDNLETEYKKALKMSLAVW